MRRRQRSANTVALHLTHTIGGHFSSTVAFCFGEAYRRGHVRTKALNSLANTTPRVGKGQLKQAIDVLSALAIAPLPLMVGVAKGPARKSGFETLFIGPEMREVWPGPESLGGHLIQHVRDEAHRFAITGHRKARAKTREKSVLEDIDGIGPTRRRAILKAFGGLRGVAKAGVEELMTVSGISRDLAERIYSAYRGKAQKLPPSS